VHSDRAVFGSFARPLAGHREIERTRLVACRTSNRPNMLHRYEIKAIGWLHEASVSYCAMLKAALRQVERQHPNRLFFSSHAGTMQKRVRASAQYLQPGRRETGHAPPCLSACILSPYCFAHLSAWNPHQKSHLPPFDACGGGRPLRHESTFPVTCPNLATGLGGSRQLGRGYACPGDFSYFGSGLGRRKASERRITLTPSSRLILPHQQ
jgi:hypothetical protein